MKNYYVEILCFVNNESFIETGIVTIEEDFVVYCCEGYLEVYKNLKDFKKSLVFNLKDFHKYCKMTLLKGC